MRTVAIVIAAGDATRWSNYLGVPKHFIPIEGEPIIERTVRLLAEHPSHMETYVVGPDDNYCIKGSHLYIPKKNPDHFGLDKFMNSMELWNPEGRTIIFYGDVYFTEDAIGWILEDDRRHFVLHARPFNSHITGTPWGECFALSFYHTDHVQIRDAMDRLIRLGAQRKIKRLGGWELYRAMLALVPDQLLGLHIVSSRNFNDINDWTDDFDYPDDYDRFMKRRKEAGI